MDAQGWALLIPLIGSQVVAVVAALRGHNTLKKEFKPNGGSSLRDAVDQITDRLAKLEERLGLGASNDGD